MFLLGFVLTLRQEALLPRRTDVPGIPTRRPKLRGPILNPRERVEMLIGPEKPRILALTDFNIRLKILIMLVPQPH